MNRYSAFMDWKIQHSKERQKKSGNKNGKKSKGFREVEYDIPSDGGNDIDVRKYKVYAGYE